jgi:superfamily II DNA or RNA helicase
VTTRTEGLPLDRFSAAQLRGLIGEIASFPPTARERGRAYAVAARVGSLRFERDAVGARVRGTRSYEVWWTWEDGSWDSSCTCPVGLDCKHQYAVACCVLEPLRRIAARVDRRLPGLLPDQPARYATLPEPRGRSGSRPAGDFPEADALADLATPRLERGAGREPGDPRRWRSPPGKPRPRPAGLARLRAAGDDWSRALVLREMLAADLGLSVSPFTSPLREILAEPDFDLMCWHLARVLPEWTGGVLPAELEPYRERPDLRQRFVQRVRQSLAARLESWPGEPRTVPGRSLRFVLGFGQLTGGLATLTVEARLTSRRLDDAPRTQPQLEQLRRESDRRPGHLAAGQAEVLDAYLSNLSDWIPDASDDYAVTTTTMLRMLEAGAGTPALVWDERLDPDVAARGAVTPGAPARLNTRAVSLVPGCEAREGRLTLDLQVRWPDGRSRALGQVVLLRGTLEGSRRHPTLVVCDGEVHRVAEEPPSEIIDQFAAAEGLPLDRKRHAALLERMAQRFPSMRDSLAPFTRVHAAAPMVALDVRTDDWMQIRLFAAAPDAEWKPLDPVARGARVHEYAPEGSWQAFSPVRGPGLSFEPTAAAPGDGDPTAPATGGAAAPERTQESPAPDAPVWLERVDDAALAPALDWLARTGARDGSTAGPGGMAPTSADAHVGWWLRLSARRMAAFAEAWSARPAGVRWYCTPGARRMLCDVQSVRPRIHVRPSGTDWFEVEAEWEAEGLTLTDADLAALRSASGPYVKVSSGWVRRDMGEVVDQAAATLAELGIEAGAGEQRLSVWQLAQASPESLSALEKLGADPAAVEAIHALRRKLAEFRGLPRAAVPAHFRGTLRPYQEHGVDFLAYSSSLGLGAILADDMGLGKTVQALAWLLWLRDRTPDLGPALVVCPASVVHNWAREAEKFAPRLRVALLTSGGGRHALLAEAESHDLLVTNYALLRRDIEAWRKVRLGAAILDEAQNIKNPGAAVSRAALALEARHRLALTGTPLENRALDLWSIAAFVSPGLLGPRQTFTARYDRADAPAHTRRLLAARLRPVLLRRMKREVAKDLPDRIEERRDCEMHPAQRRLYLAEVARGREMMQGFGEDLARHRIEILAVLTRLRQICCHPALTGASPAAGSGKFDALWEILEPLLEEGHKVLVFSQFVRCLDLLRAEMKERGIDHHVLTGQTRKREEAVARFQNDERPGVFLISLKAGGTGLNLTAASYVVLFDPWWNPAVEAQAIDRTHRIGQTRTVIAYRLLTRGTLEEKIWELQQRKAALAREILGEDGFSRTLTRADLEYLLAPESDGEEP